MIDSLQPRASEENVSTKAIVQIWCISLIAASIAALASIHWLDIPIATWCFRHFRGLQPLGNHLGSTLLVAGESLVALTLAVYRIVMGRLPGLAKITIIACATSLSVFALNEVVLKILFGMASPSDVVVQNAPHAFHFFQGSWQSSFPSGHMALATGFVATFVGQDRRLTVLLGAGAVLAAVLLVAGGWHFLSDIIAGAFMGTTAGIVTAALWRRHSEEARSS